MIFIYIKRHLAILLMVFGIIPLCATMYEDAEDGDTQGNVPPNVRGWFIYDNTPNGSVISNVVDIDKGRVINFNGSGTSNGYMLGDWTPTSAGTWNNTTEFNINWCFKYNQSYVVYMRAYTLNDIIYNGTNYGKQTYIYYTSANSDGGISTSSPKYIHHGLGSVTTDGTWQSISRDLQADFQEYYPTNQVVSVVAFLIRGTGRVDDIELTATKLAPNINMEKSSTVISDPINNLSLPKRIPGAVVEYTIKATNNSRGSSDKDSVTLVDEIPANTKLCVSTTGLCISPYLDSSSNTSGLSLNDMKYSNDNGVSYNYTPVADTNGYDSAVTNIKFIFDGVFLGSCARDRSLIIKLRAGIY